ncbi:MAG: DUF1501 domain-containing protein, partial [Planctomycetaceae bacterium]|nr:DUF1501 domain-containing protein [Planctomycetaceae bacterium]
LFMEGGPSHVDLFDPKPLLRKLAGQRLPDSFKKPVTAMGEVNSPLLADQRKWRQHGESGLWVSDWLPHTAKCADDLAVIRSCWSLGINHAGGVSSMNTGSPIAGRPSLGAWVTYGLGSENESLPAFVVMQDTNAQVVNGARNWGTGFMPAVYQGTAFNTSGNPISNLARPQDEDETAQSRKLQMLSFLNRRHAEARPQQSELEARIAGYELAFRMQAAAPEAVDLSQETETTQNLYGMQDKTTAVFGRQCLLARRLVERGVRFVQLYHGAGSKWDSHSAIEKNHTSLCAQTDLCVAGLLHDLKQRGLLETTLVVWGGEFGRTPMSEKGDGRDHNPTGFTMWMAGGGVRGGQTIGATDELGLYAVEDRLHVHDIHATIMWLLGLNHRDVVYYDKGRPERIDQNEGEPASQII